MYNGKKPKIDIGKRGLQFSYDVIKIMRQIPDDRISRILIRETIRSACSIGANIVEGGVAHSTKEFINFLAIARKSDLETNYWLQLLKLSYPGFCDKLDSLVEECSQIGKILTAIILNTKKRIIH